MSSTLMLCDIIPIVTMLNIIPIVTMLTKISVFVTCQQCAARGAYCMTLKSTKFGVTSSGIT
jgi:hypothetical protein